MSIFLSRPHPGLRWQVKEQLGVTAVASLSPGHLSFHSPSAWYSSICLSNPPTGPRPIYLQNECVPVCPTSPVLPRRFRGTMNLFYSILQMGNLPKVPDLVKGNQAASHPPQSTLTRQCYCTGWDRLQGKHEASIFDTSIWSLNYPWAGDPKEAVPSQGLGCKGYQPPCPHYLSSEARQKILHLFKEAGEAL